jgi:hypothetical protein
MSLGFSSFADSLKRVPLIIWALLALFVVCFLLVVFFQVLGLLLGFLLLVAFIVFLVLHRHSGSSSIELREFLLQENKEAEKRFLKHEIDEATFKSLVSENQKRLIEIDAGLKKQEQLPLGRDVSQVSMKRRHKLRVLLDEKEKVASELNIARQKYFKHKLDESTFREISMEKQKLLVGLETKISALYKEEAREIVQDTARRLETLKEKTEAELAAEELSEQIETRRQRKKHSKKQ